jgi:DNA-binding NarL/FixJ family response regulator
MAERRSRSTGRTRQIGVIILEPLPVVREGLALLVNSFPGCSVLARIGEPEEAIGTIRRTRRQRVTVLVSLNAAGDGHDAYSLIHHFRESYPSIGVLAMGADADAATISRALFVGADGYVDKRSDPSELCTALQSASEHVMVLTGPSSTAIGLVADALVHRRDLEGQLTPREREVLAVAAEGISARAIAERLGVRERTVTTHLTRIYRKLGVGSRLAAVRVAARSGLVTIDGGE